MITSITFPLGKQLWEKAVDSFLKVQVSVDVKIPHLRAHLQEKVHLPCGGAKNDFGIFGDDSAGNSFPLGPHFVNLGYIFNVTIALIDSRVIYTWHLTDLWQNSNFLLVYIQEPIKEFFNLHISLLPRYWSLNVSSTELSATKSGFTTFTQTLTNICSWNMLTIDCSTLIVPEIQWKCLMQSCCILLRLVTWKFDRNRIQEDSGKLNGVIIIITRFFSIFFTIDRSYIVKWYLLSAFHPLRNELEVKVDSQHRQDDRFQQYLAL